MVWTYAWEGDLGKLAGELDVESAARFEAQVGRIGQIEHHACALVVRTIKKL